MPIIDKDSSLDRIVKYFKPLLELKLQNGVYSYPDYPSKDGDGLVKARCEDGQTVVYRVGGVEVCRVKLTEKKISWGNQRPVELKAYIRVWPLELYDPIFLRPEFPHLTSGRQGKAPDYARSGGVLLEIPWFVLVLGEYCCLWAQWLSLNLTSAV